MKGEGESRYVPSRKPGTGDEKLPVVTWKTIESAQERDRNAEEKIHRPGRAKEENVAPAIRGEQLRLPF